MYNLKVNMRTRFLGIILLAISALYVSIPDSTNSLIAFIESENKILRDEIGRLRSILANGSTFLGEFVIPVNVSSIEKDRQLIIQPPLNLRSKAFPVAMRFLDKLMNPDNCTDSDYAVVDMGVGGGFAAHFQLAASDWMRAIAALEFKVPVLIIGKIKGYSTVPACDEYNQEWNCYFQYLSHCHHDFLKHGRRVGIPNHDSTKRLIPREFSKLGLAWWWGILQQRMFRLHDSVLSQVQKHNNTFRAGLGFPTEVPVGGVHVRHGDKKIDGFSFKTLHSELQVIKSSEDNRIMQMRNGTTRHEMNISLDLYIASDDRAVILEAINGGFMTSPVGVSQEVANSGVFSALNSRGHGDSMGYNATLEIITDIYYLSQCSTLVGTASSQVFRMAVDMANATGILEQAFTLDHDSLPRIRAMSARWGLPVPEDFRMPPLLT